MSRRKWRKCGFTWDEKNLVLLIDVSLSDGTEDPRKFGISCELGVFGIKSGDFTGWKNAVFWT
jgi:hypothetical protein